MTIQKINANAIDNLFDYVVNDQNSFNELFSQIAVGEYEYRDGIKNIYFNTGTYSIPLMLTYNSDTETVMTFTANAVTQVLTEVDVIFDYSTLTGNILPDLPRFIPKTLLELHDVDNSSYTDQVGKYVVVNAAETGFELVHNEMQEEVIIATAAQTVFDIPHAIRNETQVMIFISSVLQKRSVYVINNSLHTLTLGSGLTAGTELTIYYGININAFDSGKLAEQIFEATASQTDFVLDITPKNKDYVMLFIDATYQARDTYVLSGNTIGIDAVPEFTKVVVLINTDYKSDFAIETKDADYTLILDDQVIIADATSNTIDLTLPSAVGNKGKKYVVKATNITFTTAVETDGSETIYGASNFTFTSANEVVKVISDNVNWFKI